MDSSIEYNKLVGSLYLAIGIIGVICNGATVFMIISKRVFRLSAYTIMANVAFADAIMLTVAGIACGTAILWSQKTCILLSENESQQNASLHHSVTSSTYQTPVDQCGLFSFALAFCEIAAWTAGVVSYAYLGLNRCVAICFYGTKAKTFNRVSVAIFASLSTWIVGILAACVGIFPRPLIAHQSEMWSVSFLSKNGRRPAIFIILLILINIISVLLQWICSSLVLMKIWQVKQKINKNKLNQNSANRFRKQARLTFQFFYPSLLCTVSSMLYLAKPYIKDILLAEHFVTFHLIWLCNHTCNPFIYAYFNERMRMTYKEMLTCSQLRYLIRQHRKQVTLTHGSTRFTQSRRSQHNRGPSRMSTRSAKSNRNGNFVRNSLQMQSRDFEQLCEFMMRVNPLYDSSEGWRESTDDEEWENPLPETRSEAADQRESRSIVMDLGRQTVEHWARFAKKASI